MDSCSHMNRSNFLSLEDRREFLACVKRQREDHGVVRRANALLLLDDGKSCVDIAQVLYLDDDTVLFNLRYSHSGCVKLLARLGFEYRKPKTLPRVADVAKQAEFIAMYENILNSLADDEAVYFADAVHPEYQSKPAFGWVKKGTNPTVKTTAGRARVNIHGALNLENFDTPFVAPITVDGVGAVQLLAKIEARNQDKRIIHVIWDNAAYHKGPDVRVFLSRKNCRVHLI